MVMTEVSADMMEAALINLVQRKKVEWMKEGVDATKIGCRDKLYAGSDIMALAERIGCEPKYKTRTRLVCGVQIRPGDRLKDRAPMPSDILVARGNDREILETHSIMSRRPSEWETW
jgi:hypothetical protein